MNVDGKEFDNRVKTAEELMIEKITGHLIRQDYDFKTINVGAPDLERIIDYYYYERLKWCGCGDPAIAKRTIAKYLELLKIKDYYEQCKAMEKVFGVKTIYDNDLLLCLAYAMDAAEFTEHGTSIGGAWLTTDGEYFCWAIQTANEKGEL